MNKIYKRIEFVNKFLKSHLKKLLIFSRYYMILENRNEKAIFVVVYDEKIDSIYLFCSIARIFHTYLRGKVGFKNV